MPRPVSQGARQEAQHGPAYRLDAALAVLLVLGALLFVVAVPVRTESYYIDWISGSFLGFMVGASEGYLTITRFRARAEGATLWLRRSKGIPEGAHSVLAMLAVFGAGYFALIALPGPVNELTKIPLFIFDSICGTWWTIWVVYLGMLLIWSVRHGRREGRPMRVRFTQAPAG